MPSVGQPIPHDSAAGHVTGRAHYIDDLPLRSDELHVGFVGSPVAYGKIEKIDFASAKQISGVVGIFTADDIPGEKKFGIHYRDEPVLAEGEVLYVGQPVIVIAAESAEALSQARRAVKIDVQPAKPILSIEEAILQQKFLGEPRQIRRGDPQAAIASALHKLSGVFQCGGQEQFYLESHAAIVYPAEEGQLIVHSSTQHTTEIQVVVAEALGLRQHQVVCMCKRMGGGFGGKETQAAIPAILAALVAHKTGRAARIIYDKDQDMISTGKRHAYRFEWEVGFDNDGRILGMKTNQYSNAGASADLSMAVLERSMLHAENSYYIPDIVINGRLCFTNFPSNTAFRGFGGPQAMAAMENVIHSIAAHLDLDPLQVQQRNLYGTDDRNITPYGQVYIRNHLPEIVSNLEESSNYKVRRREIITQNQQDALRLRGIALSPVKFGISFTTKFLNYANALVNVYTDGTVQVSTGATEMGQGVNTKIRQLVADEFGISWDRVLLMPTSTEKNNNTSATAASASTDLNGAAAVDACRKIKQRLIEFAASRFALVELGLAESPQHVVFADGWVFDSRQPEQHIEFGPLCKLARLDRIDLGARGFFATPGVDFNRETGQGTPFFYFTQGAAVAEVEIDRFTGELSVPRVDLLIDIGRSINPSVDRGQIIGGCIQGMGWVTAECLVYNEKGELLSHSPTTYKIPATTDVPRIFNCEFFDNDDNVENIRRSKAVGEPPLMHAIAVWGAAKQALASIGVGGDLKIPATGEEILRCLTPAAACALPQFSDNGQPAGQTAKSQPSKAMKP